jgi:hypothetical protein
MAVSSFLWATGGMSIPQSRDFSLLGGNCGCRASDRLPIPQVSACRAAFGKRCVADLVFTKQPRYSYRSAWVYSGFPR